MKLLRRILLWSILVVLVVFVALNWALPVGMSFYASRSAPAIARIKPLPLKDTSVSAAPGAKLTYLGYEFEVPWSDLDAGSTHLYPKDATTQNRADIRFRSGLRLIVTTLPAKEWENNFEKEMHLPPKDLEATFGRDVMNSDYRFLKMVYEFTPDAMNHWSATRHVVSRDELLLMLKSIVPFKTAQSGIFYLQSNSMQGFQQGASSPRQDFIALHMFGDDGSVEVMVFQKDYKDPSGITQPEINRIVQSLHKIPKQT